jgi:hypothetical protein
VQDDLFVPALSGANSMSVSEYFEEGMNEIPPRHSLQPEGSQLLSSRPPGV